MNEVPDHTCWGIRGRSPEPLRKIREGFPILKIREGFPKQQALEQYAEMLDLERAETIE